jgi:hypothetical protein
LAMLCDMASMANRARDVEETLRCGVSQSMERWCLGQADRPLNDAGETGLGLQIMCGTARV